MLVIRRRAGQSLLISDNIEVEILETAQGHVKLGIRAPNSIPILRKEILLIRDENRIASESVRLDSLPRLASQFRPAGLRTEQRR